MKNKVDVTVSLDNLIGLGRFMHLMEGLYVLTFFNGLASDVLMIIEVLEDGTLKTRTAEIIWQGDSHDKTILTENMSYTKMEKLIHNQSEISTALTRACKNLLEKAVGELSEIETSKVEEKIDLDYRKSVPFGLFEIEVLYIKHKYLCTIYSGISEPQNFYTTDIDRVESFLAELKKRYDNTIKNVLEEELGKFG